MSHINIIIQNIGKYGLPTAYQDALARILHGIEYENKHPLHLGGKLLNRCRSYASIHLGTHWRAIFHKTRKGWHFHDCMSHSAYDKHIARLKND